MHLPDKSRVAIALILLTSGLAFSASAHKTEVSGDIAGIWHVEPNHSPRSGEPALVWIALTQQGGVVIPLEQCDCRLAVYEVGATDAAPVLEPTLEAIAAETYQGIPGAEVIFPAVGEYQLTLTGNPIAGATFQPFELSYTVAVAVGNPAAIAAPTPQLEASPQSPDSATDNRPTTIVSEEETPGVALSSLLLRGLLGMGAIALIIGGLFLILRQRRISNMNR